MRDQNSGRGEFKRQAFHAMKRKISILESFLSKKANARRARVIDQYRLTAGAIQENWAIDVEFSGGPLDGLQELCLRMDAPAAISNSRSRIQEFEILKLAHQGGVRVPEPLFFCKDKEIRLCAFTHSMGLAFKCHIVLCKVGFVEELRFWEFSKVPFLFSRTRFF
mgnify:CR=1 FL=1